LKAPELQFGLDDRPGIWVTLGSAIQHIMLGLVTLTFPLLIINEIYPASMLPPDQVYTLMAASFVALGVATLLQGGLFKGIGSGFLAPAVFTAAYLPSSIEAAQAGGLGLVFGMTIFAGCLEIVLAFVIRRFPQLFPPEMAGFVVMFVGLILATVSMRLIFGLSTSGRLDPNHESSVPLAAIVCVITIVTSIWFTGSIRAFGVMISLVIAVLVGYLGDFLPPATLHNPALAGSLSWPIALPTFDIAFVPSFAACALASALRSMADITTCQRINDSQWRRPERNSIHRGVIAGGMGNVFAGLVGTAGMNTYSGSIGLSAATGITSRRVAYAVGILWIVLAVIPGVPQAMALIPRSILGGALLFTSCFIVFNGIQIIADRVLDNRKIIALGMGLFVGMSHMVYPDIFKNVPSALSSLVQSDLTLATVVALLLNLVFRFGATRNASIRIPVDAERYHLASRFLQMTSAAWGTRQEPMWRSVSAATEFLELAPELVTPGTPIQLSMECDDQLLQLKISYSGQSLGVHSDDLNLDDLDSGASGHSRFAKALMARLCDDINTKVLEHPDQCVLQLTFRQ